MANLESPEGENLVECVSVDGIPREKTSRSIDLCVEKLHDQLTDYRWCLDRLLAESPERENARKTRGNFSRLEVQPSRTRNNLKRKAPLYHKGVHLKQSNNKFVARLCLTGGKGKLELGEYQSHEEAARAYDVGSFYYQRLECNCIDKSSQDKLPPVPDNISEEQKKKWVSGRARESALLFDAERDASAPERELGSACSSLFTFQQEYPGTPASYGTQGGSCCYPTDTHTPLTSASDGGNFFSGWKDRDLEFPICDLDVTSVDRRKRKGAAHVANDTTRWIPTPSLLSRRGVTNLEEQQEWNTDQNLSADQDHSHQAVPQLKMTDSICYAHCELRKQGWEWTLKPRCPTSAKMGVLFSLPRSQDAPALLMTDIVISSFYELREQGWEVHLESSKRDIIEGVTS